jgi:hypothetical protein
METRRYMLVAKATRDQPAKELRAARRAIEAHPDWKRWGDKKETMAAWMHACLMSATNEAPVSDGGRRSSPGCSVLVGSRSLWP